MEGNIVKMKKKIIVAVLIVVSIGLGVVCGSYLYNNLSEEQLEYIMMAAE